MNRISKSLGAAVLLALPLCAGAAPAPKAAYWMEQDEAALLVNGYLPDTGKASTVYDAGYGFEAQYRYWANDLFGFAAGLGYERWTATGGANRWKGDVDGDLGLVPIGASLLLRVTEFGDTRLTLEGGLRYAIAASDLTLTKDDRPAKDRTDDVDVGDGLLLRVAAELDTGLSDRVRLLGGIGYQLDLVRGSAEAFGDSLDKNIFEGLFLRVGLKVSF
jgi:hypothetical protein